MKALSIRQPWAWLIVHGHKDIENRTWFSGYSGPLLIHAGKGMTLLEYTECQRFVRGIKPDLELPLYRSIFRGGFVGLANMTTCLQRSDSPWFVGPYGFRITMPLPIDFCPAKGALGFFDVDVQPEPGRILSNIEAATWIAALRAMPPLVKAQSGADLFP